MWECHKCHEKIEDSFAACWNCGTSMDGMEDPAFRRAAGAEPGEGTPPARELVCSKCGSQEVIPCVRIRDRGEGNFGGDLQVEVYENPSALIFKGAHAGTLRASICGNCGCAELYVSNPQELLEIYRSNKPT